MHYVLGCDVGGTDIKYGLFTRDGELIERRKVATPALVDDEAYQVVVNSFTTLLADYGIPKGDVIGVGLDTPGAILADGRQVFTHNLTIDIAGLRAALSRAFPGAATAVLNDGNAGALGEMWRGRAKGLENFAMFALGTGVGAGIVVNGRIISGSHGCGGETGHMTVRPGDTRRCGCGRTGCVEVYASATGIVRNYLIECETIGEEPCDVSDGASCVFDALAEGSEAARAAIDTMCDTLALCLSNVATVSDPQMFVIGGGVAASFEHFGAKLREYYRGHAVEMMRDIPIESAILGSAAQIYGAAYASLLAGGNA